MQTITNADERADVREVRNLVFVKEEAAAADYEAGDNRCDMRRPGLGMHLGRPRRQQTVAGHRKEDPRLAVLKTSNTAAIETTAPNATIHPAVGVARHLERARQRIAAASCRYGTSPVATMPTTI